jgi:hypothetical protein
MERMSTPSVQGPYLRRQRQQMWDGAHLLLAAPPPPEARVLRRLPLAEVRACKLRHEVGAAVLIVEVDAPGPPGAPAADRQSPPGGDSAEEDARHPRLKLPFLRLTGTLVRHMAIAARAIEKLAKGEQLDINPEDLPYYCPKCGRRLSQDTKVCGSCLDRGAAHLKDSLMPAYAELIYNGFWFSPERRMLQALIDASQASVTGRVHLKLYKGNVIVTGRESPNSLYATRLVTFEDDQGAYDQVDAQGFIKLNALRLRVGAMAGRRGGAL